MAVRQIFSNTLRPGINKVHLKKKRGDKMEEKIEIDWYGNIGRAYPLSGTVEFLVCGVCGRQMNIKRNVDGPTSFVESLSGKKHKHDAFVCPCAKEEWHQKIYRLKMKVYIAEINKEPSAAKIKKDAEGEIIEILAERNKK